MAWNLVAGPGPEGTWVIPFENPVDETKTLIVQEWGGGYWTVRFTYLGP